MLILSLFFLKKLCISSSNLKGITDPLMTSDISIFKNQCYYTEINKIQQYEIGHNSSSQL